MRRAGLGRMLPAIVSIVACGADAGPDGATVRDSGGVRIVENAAALRYFEEAGRHRHPGVLLRQDPRLARTDTVAFVAAHEYHGVELDGRCCAGLDAPFDRDVAWAVRDGTVHLVDGGRPELRRIDRHGELASIHRLAISPRPATDDHMRRWREAYLADVNEAMRTRLAPVLAHIDAPEVMPVFAAPFGVAVDGAGRVWIERNRTRRSTARPVFDVLDPDGR